MRPTPFRAIAVLAAVCGIVLAAGTPRAGADAPAWERPVRIGIIEQDAEIARGSAKGSVTRLESQSSRNRNDFVVHYLLARAYGKDNRRPDAITAYGEAIALEAGCWFAWRDRGVLRWLEKDLAGAEQDLRKAISLNPRFLEALQPLGALLIERARYAEGIRVLTQALDVDPGLDSARFQIADAFLAMGVPENALQTLAPLLAKAPKDPMLRVAQARYLMAKKDYAGAQRIYKQLALENPNDAGPLKAWLGVSVESKTFDPVEGVWVLEQLRRLARTADERARITKEIDEVRRRVAAASEPVASKGPPTADDLARALRAPDAKTREAVVFYILTGVKEGFTITGDLAIALIERLKEAKGADVPAKGEDTPVVRGFALEILGTYGTPEFASIVRLSLRDSDGNVRRKAADALGKLKNRLGIAALWRYAKGRDLDLAVSARFAIYELAQKAPPTADATHEAQVAAFLAWWTSTDAREVKLHAIADVLASADRSVDELLFPLAYLDADAVVSMAAYKGLVSLAVVAEQASAEARKTGQSVPAGIDWMRALPRLDGPAVADPSGVVDTASLDLKPYQNPALAAWWLRRPQ